MAAKKKNELAELKEMVALLIKIVLNGDGEARKALQEKVKG